MIAPRIVAVLGLIAFCYFASEAVIPVVAAVFLFFLLVPVVDKSEKLGVYRSVTSLVLVLLIMGLLSSLVVMSYDGAVNTVHKLPQYSQKVQTLFKSFRGKAKDLQKSTEKFIPKTEANPPDTQKVEVVKQDYDGWSAVALRSANSLFVIFADLIIIPILTVFFLIEKTHLRRQFNGIFRSEAVTAHIGRELGEMVRGYFLGNVVVGLVTAIGFYVIFLFLKLDSPISLALISGFVNLVPFAGAILGAVLPSAQALLQFDTYSAILIILVASIGLHFVVNNIVIPKLVGSRINVNASSATVGILFWGWLWGGIGLLLAVPMMAVIRIFLSANVSTQNLGGLISESENKSTFNPVGLKRRLGLS